MSNEIRKSNDYYMNVGIQKTEIPKKKRSPFGIFAILLFFIGLGISLGLNYIYIGIGVEVLAFIFAIIHKVIKKKGIGKIILTFIGILLSVLIVLLPYFVEGIYELTNSQPIALQIFNNLTQKQEPVQEPETTSEIETESESETETTIEDPNLDFDLTKDYITNSNWQVLDDNSCFYFLDSGNYYWCKEKDNFDDNYYYGNYTVYKGQEAIDKLNELNYDSETILQAATSSDNLDSMESETTDTEVTNMASIHQLESSVDNSDTEESIEENTEETIASVGSSNSEIEQIYFIEMTNDLCYMEGEDISIQYKESKPVRYYCIVVSSPYMAKGCDLDSFNETGFIDLSKIAESDITKTNINKTIDDSIDSMEQETNVGETEIETEN